MKLHPVLRKHTKVTDGRLHLKIDLSLKQMDRTCSIGGSKRALEPRPSSETVILGELTRNSEPEKAASAKQQAISDAIPPSPEDVKHPMPRRPVVLDLPPLTNDSKDIMSVPSFTEEPIDEKVKPEKCRAM